MAPRLSLLLLLLACLLSCGLALQCYMGSLEKHVEIGCSGSCVKTAFVDNDDEAMLSCLSTTQPDGCMHGWVLVNKVTCFCNSDRCNASPPSVAASSLLLLLLPSLLIVHRVFV